MENEQDYCRVFSEKNIVRQTNFCPFVVTKSHNFFYTKMQQQQIHHSKQTIGFSTNEEASSSSRNNNSIFFTASNLLETQRRSIRQFFMNSIKDPEGFYSAENAKAMTHFTRQNDTTLCITVMYCAKISGKEGSTYFVNNKRLDM